MQGSSLEVPTGYYLERDPDVLIVRRLDGSMVGAFSARGATPEAVLEAVEEDAPLAPPADLETPMPTARPALRARFFGHFEMFCDDEAVPLRPNGKVLAILKYLLAHRTRPVSQDHLMGWLWPESSPKKARWSLNSAIHVLRKLLSSCSPSPTVNYILLEEGYYRLCPEVRVATDMEEFDLRYEEGCRLERAGRRQEAVAEYEEAIKLYRGDYLVEDLYEDWTMVERERLANAYVDMLGRLAAYYLESGQHQRSIRACYRLLEKDRCHEDSYRVLMRCYVGLGLRGRALRHYRLCEEVLEQEYGTVPSSETRSLYSSILGMKVREARFAAPANGRPGSEATKPSSSRSGPGA
jgi:LuxR family maltose regulon positive regulatory protein